MTAVGGTSRNGEQHHYYRCKNCSCGCTKKAEHKSFIEWYVAGEILQLLNMADKRDALADKAIEAYKAGMETDETAYPVS